MSQKREQKNATEILNRRYVQGDAAREASIREERVNADVAQLVYDIRTNAGLTQSQLAGLTGTTQSAISRLEDADYRGHSLTMLRKIAHVLDRRLEIRAPSHDYNRATPPLLFRILMQKLRRRMRLTVDQLAERVGIDREELARIETDEQHVPTPLVLRQLAGFYDIPEEKLVQLAGLTREIPESLREHASAFAARSAAFTTLTSAEKRAVDEFVNGLRRAPGDPVR